jgi:GT2 family glycosyltransferase
VSTTRPPEPRASRPAVAVIVLHLDAEDETRRCLRALAASRYENATVHLLDNGSARRLGRIDEAPPRLRVSRSETNLGFAGGANRLATQALAEGASHLLFLNNDALVAEDAIDRLVDAALRTPRGGIFGARILGDNGRVESDGERVRLRWLRRQSMRASSGATLSADAVLGCAMLVTRSVAQTVGLFDERYFAYFEEIDLCLRARRAGFEVAGVPGARVVHRGFGSSGGSMSPLAAYLRARNSKLLVRAHGSVVDRTCFALVHPAVTARDVVRFLAAGRRDLAAAALRGAIARGCGPPRGGGGR